VIQGSFLGGQPRLATVAQWKVMPPPIQTKTAVRSPGPPAPAFAGRRGSPVQAKVALRPPGPPAPAFAGRAATVQRHGGGGAFAVEAGPLGLLSGGGKPLPDAVRGKMEAALHADFSKVLSDQGRFSRFFWWEQLRRFRNRRDWNRSDAYPRSPPAVGEERRLQGGQL
jgi:hypothetical protein